MPSFSEWNKRLKPFFSQGMRFIGEINLSFSDVEDLASSLKKMSTSLTSLAKLTEFVIEHPYAFLTLLSGFASYNTNRDYWESFATLVHLDRTQIINKKWHRLYVELARKQRLKVFDFADDPTPYVTSIRFQGGIPAYSLPDYFEKMVLPAVQRQDLKEVNPAQALKYLLEHTYFVDSPVFDFLENSGELGVEFFDASCKLVKHTLTHHGEILPANEVDLPAYVVEAFERWWEHREDARQHWTKPFLQAAPYSEDTAMFLQLPQQEITLELSANRLFWLIKFPHSGIHIKRNCRVIRSRQSVVTQNEYLPIPEPMERIEVSLNALQDEEGKAEELRRWSILCIPPADKTPLVAFNGDGIQLSTTRQLPAETLFLLTPLGSKLILDGQGHQVEENLPLVGAWKNWQLQRWDLSQAWSVRLEREGQSLGEIIPIQGIIAQPELVDGHLFQFQDLEAPMYTSGLPSLRIPLSPGNTPHIRLSTWEVHVRSIGDADPCIDKIIHLNQFISQIEFNDDRGIFPLKNLLDENAAGNYEIVASGPRGLSAEFHIRLWPKLIVLGYSTQLIQPVEDSKPSVFTLLLQEGAACELQSEDELVGIKQTVAGWIITVPPELNRVLLYLTTKTKYGKVRVPVSIPLPKLRWGLVIEKEGDKLEWGQQLLHRSIEQVLQAGSISLHMEMYKLGSLHPDLKVRLIEMGDTENILQDATLTHTDFTRDWMRVSLGQFVATIQQINSLARFEMVYFPRNKDTKEVRIPLLELNRALDIDQPKLESVNETTWRLTWHEEHPFKNRRFMILPAWQPWLKPWEYKIPNKARGEFLLEEISLLPMRYLLFFYIMPVEERELQKPPQELSPFTMNLCTAQDRIATIQVNETNHNERFKNLIELAIIYDSLGDGSQRDLMFSKAATSLIHLSNDDLLVATLRWMQDKTIDKPIKNFFFNAMFNFQLVEAIIDSHKPDDPNLMEYLEYTSKAKVIPAESAKLLLKRINYPVVIVSCLHSLLNKKDPELLGIVTGMMREARLSTRDAQELLMNEEVWGIEQITKLTPGPYEDDLLAKLLLRSAQQKEILKDPRLCEWMVRAIPYTKESELIETYLRCFFEMNYPGRFEILLQNHTNGKISDHALLELLSMNPKKSLDALNQEKSNEEYQNWIIKLIETFPEAAGIVKVGSKLNTPFGLAIIDFIQKRNHGKISRIRLGEPDCCINAHIYTGQETLKLIIDYHEMKIKFEGIEMIWKCSRCNYMHPDQRNVMRHASDKHKAIVLSSIQSPVLFSEEDIQLV